MENFKITVPFLGISKRVDAFLAGAVEGRFSRTQIKRALQAHQVFLNGKPAGPSSHVEQGDVVEGTFPDVEISGLLPENFPLRVIYEDESFLVIDKPAGLVVHPGIGNKSGTLVHALLGRGSRYSNLGGLARPGIVHRIDKDTSGLLLVAKDNRAHRKLQSQFAARSLSKIYLAFVKGSVEYEQGHVDFPIGRHPKIRQKMAVVKDEKAKPAQTFYRVLKRFYGATLLQVKIETGRTHQIRVHMAHIGYPVMGDILYGGPAAPRNMLHAWKLELDHPVTGKRMAFESPIPQDFQNYEKSLHP